MQNRPHTTYVTRMLGKRVDVDGAYGFQCVDLFKDYCSKVLGYNMRKTGSAKEAYNNKYKAFDNTREKIISTKDLMQGDIIFSVKGPDGHVGVVDRVVGNKVYVFEQNGSGKNSGSGIGANAIRVQQYSFYFWAGVWRCKKTFDNLQLERAFIDNKLKTMLGDTSETLNYKNSIRYVAK